MDSSTWYYTLSTIAQVLAALLGLTAIFVVLKLEALSKEINDYKWRGINLSMRKLPKESDKFEKLSAEEILVELGKFKNDYYQLSMNVRNDFYNLVRVYRPNLDPIQDPNRSDYVTKIDEPVLGFLEGTKWHLKQLISEKNRIISAIKTPTIITLLTISLALVFLSTADIFRSLRSYDILLLILVTIGSLVSIFKIASASFRILKSME